MRTVKSGTRGVVLTMGTFDGVHRGHREILRRTVRLARRLGVPSLAVTFSRPPRLFFFPSEGPCLLTLLPEKVALLKAAGIDRVVALRFGRALARMSAERFFRRYFLRRYRVRAIVVGYNFGFGRDRRGDTRFLEKRGGEHDMPVHVVPPVCLRGVPVSSGQIREHLRAGDLSAANRKMGAPYFLTGRVVRGAGRGRRLGFPTANLRVAPEKILPPGVYAVKVTLPGGGAWRGMCNVGVRPTVSRGTPRPSVEVHLLGFKGALGGKALRLDFLKKLRAERKFPSLKALSRQLAMDKAAVRRISLRIL